LHFRISHLEISSTLQLGFGGGLGPQKLMQLGFGVGLSPHKLTVRIVNIDHHVIVVPPYCIVFMIVNLVD